jgi:hypothetical protein
MKHVKSFRLFESKYHKLVLPKTEADLKELQKLDSYKRIASMGGSLNILRNGTLEIGRASGYSFKVTVGGIFYYGSYPVGPQNVELDTWDKLFDYVYIYFLANNYLHLQGVKSQELENFVFNGSINVNTYNKIKGSRFYTSLLDLSRKYNGPAVDETISKVIVDTNKYITDLSKVLEIPAYKFFNSVFNFEPELENNGMYIRLKNETPFGIFDKGEGLHFGSRIEITLEGAPVPSTYKIRVKTLKGLENAFLKKIKDLWNNYKTYYRYQFSQLSEEDKGKRKFAIELADQIIAIYESGSKEITTDTYNFIHNYLMETKKSNPLFYAQLVKDLSETEIFYPVVKDLMKSDSDLIQGGSALKTFGFGG